jgi:hypothetical protein
VRFPFLAPAEDRTDAARERDLDQLDFLGHAVEKRSRTSANFWTTIYIILSLDR